MADIAPARPAVGDRVMVTGDGREGFPKFPLLGRTGTVSLGVVGQRDAYPEMVFVRIDGQAEPLPIGFAPEHLTSIPKEAA